MSAPEEEVTLSLNLSKLQFILALIAHAVGILATALTLALWIGRILMAQEFQTQLDIFHSHAVPEIEKMMDAKINDLARERIVVTSQTTRTISERLATLEQQAKATDATLIRIESKLDRALQ